MVIGCVVFWALAIIWVILIIVFSGGWEEHFDSKWQLISKWDYNDQNQKDWKRIEYYANGQKKSKWKYDDWQQDWKWKLYNENWQLKEKRKYDDGELEELIQYNEYGKITNETTYKDWAERSKKTTSYYDNGRLKEKKEYYNGQLE